MGAPSVDPSDPEEGETRFDHLRAGREPVRILARVVRAERREVLRRADGSRRPIVSGLLTDGSATVRFTWWDPPADEIAAGDVLRAAPVTVREYEGRVEIVFGSRTRVEPASPSELSDPAARAPIRREVRSLEEGEEDGFLEVRVETVRPRTVLVRGQERSIFDGVLRDGSGSVPFTAWADLGLVPGETLRIPHPAVRSYRGTISINLDERSGVERVRIPDPPAPGGGGEGRPGRAAPATSTPGPPGTPPGAPPAAARSGGPEARIRFAPPTPPAPSEPSAPEAGLILGLVDELSEGSLDGYADRTELLERLRSQGLGRASAEPVLELLLAARSVVEPIEGKLRRGSSAPAGD